MANVRKFITTKEIILQEMGKELPVSITRVSGMAVISNPLANKFSDDLTALFGIGRDIGERLSDLLAGEFKSPIISYGKAAIVGLHGEMEHGGACIHPMLGKPMRQAIGGGKSVIPSNVKVAAAGATIDVPLSHKDDAWSFDHFDTMTLALADAPRPEEIVVVLAFADGGRPFPRCGSGPI